LIGGPEFFLDLGKARLLVNSSPEPGGPPGQARSMIGLKSFTFSGEQPSSLRARPREFLLVGLCAQVRPIRYRDHVVTAFAQPGRDGG
jgi:hypothetical protein